MRKPYEGESIRWFTHAKDEFEDEDDLKKRGKFYLAILFMSVFIFTLCVLQTYSPLCFLLCRCTFPGGKLFKV